MDKPTDLPVWDENETNAIEPAQSRQDDGWLAPAGVPEKPPFQYFNWWQNNVYKWINYFFGVDAASKNAISGLVPSNNSGNPNTHIDISIGAAKNSSGDKALELLAATVKDLSNTFVAGSGNGGLYTAGGLSADTDYYGFIIEKDSDASIDFYYDISINAANIPVGYTAYRLADAFKSDSSGFIPQWKTKEIAGNIYREAKVISPLRSGSSVTGRQLLTCDIPAGLEVMVHVNGHALRTTTSCATWIRTVDFTDVLPSLGPASDLGVRNAVDSISFVYKDVLSDVNAQIAYRSSTAGQTLIITQAGYTLIRN